MVNMPDLTRTSQRHADLTSQVASVHAAVVKVDEKADRVLEGQAALAQGQVVVKQGLGSLDAKVDILLHCQQQLGPPEEQQQRQAAAAAAAARQEMEGLMQRDQQRQQEQQQQAAAAAAALHQETEQRMRQMQEQLGAALAEQRKGAGDDVAAASRKKDERIRQLELQLVEAQGRAQEALQAKQQADASVVTMARLVGVGRISRAAKTKIVASSVCCG